MGTEARINVDNTQKVVHIIVAGKVTEQEAREFDNEYKTKIGAINPSLYTLEADCSAMQVLTPEMTERLTGVMKMYKAAGFKKIIYQVKSNPILKMQLSRVSRNAGIAQDVSIVDIG